MYKPLLVTLLLLLSSGAHAQWSANPNINNAISTASSTQWYPTIASDGSGGAIITWYDSRSGTSSNYDIYAQRTNAAGAVQWTANGVAISTASDNQEYPNIVGDGSGGAIITWQDLRSGLPANSDIYAQRINAAGAVQWTANGVAISTASGAQYRNTIVSDGSGGAIITWEDRRSGLAGNSDIYAQRINAAGAVQWTANGVAISTATSSESNPTIGSDGSGGAIITWQDYRSGPNSDIYAQWINAAGTVQWTANGVAISTASNNQTGPTILSDGSGGVIITWHDRRSGGTNDDIYAQRINAAGAVQWTANGVAISTASGGQAGTTIVSDGSGGAIITWGDNRSGTNSDIYTQRINAAGEVQWTVDGVPISTASNIQHRHTIVGDGSGGAIITWQDSRSGATSDIYAQRINAAGAVLWTVDGVAISTASSSQERPTIVSDGSGGAIITWDDYRSGTNFDIHAQQVSANGVLGQVTSVSDKEKLPLHFALYQNYPNPFNPSTRIEFRVPSSGFVELRVYEVLGREVATLVNEELTAGSYEATFNADGLASGVYLYRLQAGAFAETKKMILTR